MEITGPFGPNWAVNLLPYIEQAPLYQSMNRFVVPASIPAGGSCPAPAGVDGFSWRVGVVGRPIAAYRCPTDAKNNSPYIDAAVPGDTTLGGIWARGNYGISAGYEDYDHVAGGNTYTSSHSQLAGMNGLKSTPLCSSNWGSAIKDVSDGTSQQFMFTELRAGLIPNDPRGIWAMGFPGVQRSERWSRSLQSQSEQSAGRHCRRRRRRTRNLERFSVALFRPTVLYNSGGRSGDGLHHLRELDDLGNVAQLACGRGQCCNGRRQRTIHFEQH